MPKNLTALMKQEALENLSSESESEDEMELQPKNKRTSKAGKTPKPKKIKTNTSELKFDFEEPLPDWKPDGGNVTNLCKSCKYYILT
jgi:hypothetical protein